MRIERPPMRPGGSAPYGLASTMLRVTAAELTDSGRNMRGRRLQDERAVLWIDVEPGVLSGVVQGSEPTPYAVRWLCPRVRAHVEAQRRALAVDDSKRATRLVPGANDLSVTCTCADDGGDGVCKHAIAVLLELADDIGRKPDVLSLWRDVEFDATEPVDPADGRLDHRPPIERLAPRAVPSSTSSDDAALERLTGRETRRHLRLVRDQTAQTPFVDPLADLLAFPPGARLLSGRTKVEPLGPPEIRNHDDVLRAVLRDSLEWMQGASPW